MREFFAVRDQLFADRDDHEAACAVPLARVGRVQLGHDVFDHLSGTALRVVGPEGERVLSFAELGDWSRRAANWLERLGVRRGDPVVVVSDNHAELWVALLALIRVGAVIVPVYPTVTPGELARRVERAGARAVVADPASVPLAPELPVRITFGGPSAGWRSLYDAAAESPRRPHPLTQADDPPRAQRKPRWGWRTPWCSSAPSSPR